MTATAIRLFPVNVFSGQNNQTKGPVMTSSSQKTSSNTPTFISKLKEYAEMVKFEHTIFALPFALSAMIMAAPLKQWPQPETFFWIILAMVGGRTFAMGLNRLIDAHIDAKNPRTQDRAIPAGRVSKKEGWILTLLAGGLLAFATFQLPIICRQLLPVAYIVLTLYSYMKRFSALAHLVLGVALGSSAVGGWLAVTGIITLEPLLFGFTVMFWVAGFDIIYACQDIEFDQQANLKSIPSQLGAQQALLISKLCHLSTIGLLIWFGLTYADTGIGFWMGVVLTAGMLVYEHWIIRGRDGNAINLEKVNAAFFTINGQISISMFVLILIDKWLQVPLF